MISQVRAWESGGTKTDMTKDRALAWCPLWRKVCNRDNNNDDHDQHRCWWRCDDAGSESTPARLPLVECLLPVVTKSFCQTSQCEWGEEGFPRWDPSSGAASQRGERSRSEPPETRTGPWWAAHVLTGRRSGQVPGILQLPDVGSEHQTNIRAGLLEEKSDKFVPHSVEQKIHFRGTGIGYMKPITAVYSIPSTALQNVSFRAMCRAEPGFKAKS